MHQTVIKLFTSSSRTESASILSLSAGHQNDNVWLIVVEAVVYQSVLHNRQHSIHYEFSEGNNALVQQSAFIRCSCCRYWTTTNAAMLMR